MNFYIFTDGVPTVVHQFNNPTPGTENYYVYTPPVRDTPYLFKMDSKRSEFIYSFLFPLNKDDKAALVGNTHKVPARLKSTIAVFDLVFSKEFPDYGAALRDIMEAIHHDFYVITDRGVQTKSTLSMYSVGTKQDAILSVHSERMLSTGFMNIVDKCMTKLKLPQQEAYDVAIETGIFGDDFYYATTPKWYTLAKSHYGSGVS